MSDTTDAVGTFGETLAAEFAAAEAGETEGETSPTGEAEASTDEATDTGDQSAPVETYKVTVDGVEREVTLDDLVSNFSKGENYTRKSQELATERERLQFASQIAEALRDDPEQALFQLLNHYRVDPRPWFEQEQGETEELDPWEQKVQQLEQYVTSQQEEEFARQVYGEIDRIKTEFKDDALDPDELLDYASDNGITNLEKAYLARWAEKLVQAQANGKGEAKPSKADEEAERAKRAAAALVESGSSRNAGQAALGGDKPSLREALAAAVEEHGGWDFGDHA